jgi:hypothetical protein
LQKTSGAECIFHSQYFLSPAGRWIYFQRPFSWNLSFAGAIGFSVVQFRWSRQFTWAVPNERCFHFLEASQLQLALPECVPFIRPPASRPFQYWVVTGFFRVKAMLEPLIWPSVIVPMSCHDVPAKLPPIFPRDVRVRSNSPSQRPPPPQSAIQRHRPATETSDG